MCLAVPGCIDSIVEGADPFTRPFTRIARVRFGTVHKEVNLSLVPEAQVGDYVLVHVGVALQRIDAAEAERVFELLEAVDELEAGGGKA